MHSPPRPFEQRQMPRVQRPHCRHQADNAVLPRALAAPVPSYTQWLGFVFQQFGPRECWKLSASPAVARSPIRNASGPSRSAEHQLPQQSGDLARGVIRSHDSRGVLHRFPEWIACNTTNFSVFIFKNAFQVRPPSGAHKTKHSCFELAQRSRNSAMFLNCVVSGSD